MLDLPGPGFEPVSPALAGGFLTTAPPGKSLEVALMVAFSQKKPFQVILNQPRVREKKRFQLLLHSHSLDFPIIFICALKLIYSGQVFLIINILQKAESIQLTGSDLTQHRGHLGIISSRASTSHHSIIIQGMA